MERGFKYRIYPNESQRDPATSWLAQVDSMALQQSIRDLDRAYKNFFRRVREGGKPGFPKFKSRRHARQSYRTNGGRASSKTCSACGHRLDALPLSVRVWDCPACGAHHDRDVNAARNILTEGKRILSNTEGTAGHAGTVAAITA